MRCLIFPLSILICPIAGAASISDNLNDKQHASLTLDYDIHLTNGSSNVTLSVTNDVTGEVNISIIDADDDSFLAKVQTLINEQGSEAFARVDCDVFKKMIPAKAVSVSNDNGNTAYSFKPVPAADDDPNVFENWTGLAEMTNSANNVLRITLSNDATFSPSFGSSISRLTFAIECLPVADTKTVLKKYNLLIQGSAFLVPFEERIERTYTNYRPSSSSDVDQK